MHYNICILQPVGYVHAMAFWELGEAVQYAIRELGHTSSMGINSVFHDTVNVVIGCHLMDVAQMAALPPSSIILNVEQVYADDTDWNAKIFQWVRHFDAWDYSERNLIKLRDMGAKNAKLLRLGFQKELRRIEAAAVQDIDVLFYGAMNDRRARILEQLDAQGLVVKHLFGVYGQERDDYISRSKVVLNMHMYNSQIFEAVRVSYLLINSAAVVAEVNPQTATDLVCHGGVCAVPYEDLAEACVRHARSEDLRTALRQQAFAAISRYPQADFMRELLPPPP
jgi:hypothetical protein